MMILKRMRLALLLWAVVLCFTEAAAQKRDSLSSFRASAERLHERVDSALTVRYYKSPFDSDYVIRPEGRLTVKLRANQSGNSFHVKGTVNDIHSKADLKTSNKTTFAVVGIYRGLGLGVAINPAKWKGLYKDYELNFNYYSSWLSIDGSYARSSTLAGDIHRGDDLERLESDNVSLKIVNIAAYYIFNHRKFSYSAAFTQSYIQRCSAGSWLAGISYQGGCIKTSDELKAKNDNAPDIHVDIGHIGIGGGYGYNWVLGKKWLLHFSMVPTFVVYNRNKFTLNDELKRAHHMRFNMIFNERAAIVRNFSPRYFAGITLAMNNSIFDDNVVVVNQNKWRLRGFFGFRL